MEYKSKFTGPEIDGFCDKVNELCVENILFIGTQSQYEVAFNEGKITTGSLVIIIDNDDPASDEFSSILGVGVLGKMILI